MVDTRELTAGRSMEFPPVPLRLSLTGTAVGVRLTTMRPDGTETAGRRVSDTELMVLPVSGDARVVAVPASGTAFPAGTRLGIDITTDSATVESRQAFMQPVDVGALQSHDLAAVSFDAESWTVTAASTAQPSSRKVVLDGYGAAPRPGSPIDDQVHPWVGPGRFALRRAASNGAQLRSSGDRNWGLVVDSSASMRRTYGQRELEQLVQLVAGIFGEWTGRPPASTYLSGIIEPVPVTGAISEPKTAATASYTAAQPASWSIVTPAVRASVRGHGQWAVVVVTDGVPGDAGDLMQLAQTEPELDVFLLTTGASRFGLPGDTSARQPWEEELAALEPLAALPNVHIAALDINTRVGFEDERRAAELASLLLVGGA